MPPSISITTMAGVGTSDGTSPRPNMLSVASSWCRRRLHPSARNQRHRARWSTRDPTRLGQQSRGDPEPVRLGEPACLLSHPLGCLFTRSDPERAVEREVIALLVSDLPTGEPDRAQAGEQKALHESLSRAGFLQETVLGDLQGLEHPIDLSYRDACLAHERSWVSFARGGVPSFLPNGGNLRA